MRSRAWGEPRAAQLRRLTGPRAGVVRRGRVEEVPGGAWGLRGWRDRARRPDYELGSSPLRPLSGEGSGPEPRLSRPTCEEGAGRQRQVAGRVRPSQPSLRCCLPRP